jgi:hypothetical protein
MVPALVCIQGNILECAMEKKNVPLPWNGTVRNAASFIHVDVAYLFSLNKVSNGPAVRF